MVDGSDRLTWDHLVADVHRVASGLQAGGIGPGDGIALVLDNDRGFVTTFLAAQVLGAMAVPLNPRFTTDELARHLAACDGAGRPLAAIVAEPGLVPVLRTWVDERTARPLIGDVRDVRADDGSGVVRGADRRSCGRQRCSRSPRDRPARPRA